jgi:pSer/pThr/pTyr-binding forkhead associated (FHA) protein
MIFIEILSRHREIAARFRIAGPEARIGRGYDNDVIVDDPYVAARHLRIFRDQGGQLVAEDMGSVNGTFLESGKIPLPRITIDRSHVIRIGHTLLRVREIDHEVERERVAQPQLRTLPIAVAVPLGVTVLAINALKVWLAETNEPRVSSYLTPLLVITAIALAWVGMWALLSRVFSGRSHFLRNLLIALAGMLAFLLYDEFARFAAFAWTWPLASMYQYVAVWSILAVVGFLHLREVGPARLRLKGALVAALLATAISVQALQRSEAFSDSGRQTTARQLMPPEFRLVPLRDESAFFGDIARLKERLDGDRSQARADEAAAQAVP